TEDAQGNIWLASGHGLFKQHLQGNEIEVFYDPNTDFYNENHNLFLDVKNFGDSILWLGTWAGGLKKFNMNTKSFETFLLQPNNPYAGNRNIVDRISRKSTTQLWIASLDKGLAYFDIPSKQFHFYAHDPLDKNSPWPKECRRIYIDKYNSLWAGFDEGFSIYHPAFQYIEQTNISAPKSNFFTEQTIQALYFFDRTQQIYYGTDVGNCLYVYDLVHKKIKQLPTKGLITERSGIYSVSYIEKWTNEELLVQVNGLFYLYKLNEGYFEPFMLPISKKVQHIKGRISTMNQARECWILDEGVYFKFKLGTKQILQYSGETGQNLFPLGAGAFILREMNDSLLWAFDRVKGLVLLHTKSNKVYTDFYQKNAYPIKDPKQVVVDKNGHFWFATFNEGLFEMWLDANKKFNQKRYTSNEGLQDLFLNDINIDQAGYVWLTSNKGITQFDSEKKMFKNFNSKNGLSGSAKWIPTIHAGSNGAMYFGAVNCFLSIADTCNYLSKKAYPVVLKSFNIFNKPWCDTLNINLQKRIELQWHQNFISFTFASLNLIDAKNCQYAYKLEGVDRDWNYCDHRQFASYAALNPGEYTLFIKSTNEDGYWHDKSLQLQIYIHPPFWQTWWFYGLIVFCVVVGLGGLFKYRIYKVHKAAQVKNDYNKQIAEIEMKALRAQMNPHFIFNSLNSINKFILKNDSLAASSYLTKFAKLIRLILDNSSNELTTLQSEIQLIQLYVEIERLRFSDAFRMHWFIDETIDTAHVLIPPMIIQPYVENAIWHGLLPKKKHGNLFIRIHNQNQGCIKIEIEDDGIGRELARKQQGKSATQEKSYGMKISGDRIKLANMQKGHAMEVEIIDLYNQNQQATGTKIVINLSY
nr:histidine kinase [Chitinophagaceae bacterium]